MIVVPPGEFTMGSPADEFQRQEDEGPQRVVQIDYAFAVGVFEVTFDEWQHCLDQGGCTHNPNDWDRGRGRKAVEHVSWLDAQKYLRWLSAETGHTYRLLTEAEWEYAARAGTSTRFWWGDETAKGRAVCAGCSRDGNPDGPREVGAYAANPFGLYNVHGNVSEWVEDCWSPDYEGHPTDGSAWTPTGECRRRVLRGGTWPNGSRHLRSANRSWKGPDYRSRYGKGFRVAMTLP